MLFSWKMDAIVMAEFSGQGNLSLACIFSMKMVKLGKVINYIVVGLWVSFVMVFESCKLDLFLGSYGKISKCYAGCNSADNRSV